MNTFIYFTAGLGLGLIIHAVLWLRMEDRHDDECRDEYEQGRKRGYHQCHGELVAPMEHFIEMRLGRKINWQPLHANMPDPIGVETDGTLVYSDQQPVEALS